MLKSNTVALSYLKRNRVLFLFCTIFFLSLVAVSFLAFSLYNKAKSEHLSQLGIQKALSKVEKQLVALQNQDQLKKNKVLEEEIANIHKGYSGALAIYQQLQDLRDQKADTSKLDTLFAQALENLSVQNYSSAEASLSLLSSQIAALNAPSVSLSANVSQSNTAPGSGFSRQSVTSDVGTFVIDIVAADLNSTRVIVDTASDSDCSNNCPVLPLSDYVARNNAFAGINGSYFCPSDYPSCAGKVNSFDTLLMNKNKKYLNSSNNVYSSVPLVYFTGNTMGVRSQSSQWGRDTGIDSVIAMQPLLVLSSQIVYSGSDIGKYNQRGIRDFIGNKGSTVYIGSIESATMGEGAHVLKALGIENALNLDEGGSTALWFGGYKFGPGRNIPNAVLFVRK